MNTKQIKQLASAFGVVVFLWVGNSWGKISPSSLKMLEASALSKAKVLELEDWDDTETIPAYLDDQSDISEDKHAIELARVKEMIEELRERNPGDSSLEQLERVEQALLGLKERLSLFEQESRKELVKIPGKVDMFVNSVSAAVKELYSAIKSLEPSFVSTLFKYYVLLQAIPLMREVLLLVRDNTDAVKSLMAMITMSIVSMACVYWKKLDSSLSAK